MEGKKSLIINLLKGENLKGLYSLILATYKEHIEESLNDDISIKIIMTMIENDLNDEHDENCKLNYNSFHRAIQRKYKKNNAKNSSVSEKVPKEENGSSKTSNKDIYEDIDLNITGTEKEGGNMFDRKIKESKTNK